MGSSPESAGILPVSMAFGEGAIPEPSPQKGNLPPNHRESQSGTADRRRHVSTDLPMTKGVGDVVTCRPPSHWKAAATAPSSDKLCRWSVPRASASLSVTATDPAKSAPLPQPENIRISGSRIFVFVCFGVLEEERPTACFFLRRPGSGAVGHRGRLLPRRAPAGAPPSFLRHPDF